MRMNQDLFNVALKGVVGQLAGTSPVNVRALESRLALMYKACNPLAYDPSNPAAVFTPAQYTQLFNYRFSALEDPDGEMFYFDENFELESFKARFAYVVADPHAKSSDRSQPANQAVASEALNLLVRSSGSASDELALYVIGVIQDAMSQRNPQPAVLSDIYREILTDIHAAFKKDGAGEVVLDRLETLLTTRSQTSLIVDAEGVARPDKGQWC